MSVSLLDNFSHCLQAQTSRPETDRAVRPLAITISRQAGAGAVTVAELVHQRLTAAETEPAKSVREQDQARRRYLRRYFNAEIDEPTLYDMTLNTGRLGFVRAAEVIAEAGLRHHQAFAEREGSLKVSLE